jgi:bifunctional non-homologous end joining protein LigD
MNLSAYVMTSGSRGLHVAVPIKPESDFDTVRQFAKDTANYIVQKKPDAFTIEFSKDKRKGRLLIDYLRNSYAQTSIAPYAVRARTGAPIATPLRWQELDLRGLSAQKYTVNNIFRRLGQMSDPWQHFFRDAASIKEARKFLNHSR